MKKNENSSPNCKHRGVSTMKHTPGGIICQKAEKNNFLHELSLSINGVVEPFYYYKKILTFLYIYDKISKNDIMKGTDRMATTTSIQRLRQTIHREHYLKNYRRQNREKINKYNREWRKNNPEKWAKYMINYFKKVAFQKATEREEREEKRNDGTI